MRKLALWIFALAVLSAGSLYAQNLAGDWQGTLQAGKQTLRTVVKISKADNGSYSAMFYSIDQGSEGMVVDSISLQDSTLKFAISKIHGSYEGKLSADGASISGIWTQGSPLPLDLQRASNETAWATDSSPHTVQFVPVEPNVKLEVLDWGGTGRPLILLAGLGNTAHIFDKFAPKLTSTYHVYGITRRGYGVSSAPTPSSSNYSADRLGDDVLAVIDALKLDRPILAGHSIAGEELSSVGSRYPNKVAGLIYLDAGYPYAFYDRTRGDITIDSIELRKKLDQLSLMPGPRELKPMLQELLQTSLPQYEKDLQELVKQLHTMPDSSSTGAATEKTPRDLTPSLSIIQGEEKYTEIKVPILAIFAVPHNLGSTFASDPAAREAAQAADLARTTAQANAFEAGVPSAHVVRLPNANHYVFNSNEADVLREMSAFMAKLP
jgi:pimeloyl-ACP methyl ester carboxylesterase